MTKITAGLNCGYSGNRLSGSCPVWPTITTKKMVKNITSLKTDATGSASMPALKSGGITASTNQGKYPARNYSKTAYIKLKQHDLKNQVQIIIMKDVSPTGLKKQVEQFWQSMAQQKANINIMLNQFFVKADPEDGEIKVWRWIEYQEFYSGNVIIPKTGAQA